MLRMSFMNGTLTKEKAIELINRQDWDLVFTYGLEYRHPTTYRVPISKEEAIKIIEKEELLDIDQIGINTLKLNAYSSNDLW